MGPSKNPLRGNTMKRQLSPNGKPAVNGHSHKSAIAINGHGKAHHGDGNQQASLMPSPLLPEGYYVPATRNINPSTRMRQLLESEPYLFGPGVYDPMTAQLVMYYGFKAIYFSGYSFAMGYLGTTDMDLYSGPEIADAARRTVSALRKFQLTQAVGDPEKGTAPRHLDIPPLIVDMDGGYGNIFNVQRICHQCPLTAGIFLRQILKALSAAALYLHVIVSLRVVKRSKPHESRRARRDGREVHLHHPARAERQRTQPQPVAWADERAA